MKVQVESASSLDFFGLFIDDIDKVVVMFKTKIVSAHEIVLSISGSMTGESVGLFERALDSLQKSSYRTITLDLSNVVDVSSMFVGHILHCQKNLATENRTIRIFGYQDSVGAILKLLNVNNSIQMEKDPI
jgi:anti-anti-sigma regulatory factor